MYHTLTKSYTIIETYEVWLFEQTAEYGSTNGYSKGLFCDYVYMLLKTKQVSGWPEYAVTEDKDRFLAEYRQQEGKNHFHAFTSVLSTQNQKTYVL